MGFLELCQVPSQFRLLQSLRKKRLSLHSLKTVRTPSTESEQDSQAQASYDAVRQKRQGLVPIIYFRAESLYTKVLLFLFYSYHSVEV